MPNEYSRLWFEVFLETRPSTQAELAFLTACLPDPPFHRLLDLPCGQGRHANLLARLGYQVLGIDRDLPALQIARQATPSGASASYFQADMRWLCANQGTFDGVYCMWQSFGHFTHSQNAAVIAQVAHLLRSGGRFVLDIYHPEFWASHLGSYTTERRGVKIHTSNRMQGDRLFVEIRYTGGDGDNFDWQLYSPVDIQSLAAGFGLQPLQVCSGYNLQQSASADLPLYQTVFEKRSE